MELLLSGLASGFDWQSVVEKLVEVDRLPQQRLRTEQDQLADRNLAYDNVKTQFEALKSRVDALNLTSLFDTRKATVATATVASATATGGSAVGTYSFAISQLATTSKQAGIANAGSRIHSSSDVSGIVLSSAGFPTGVTAGTLTVNGKQITVATSDTLADVFAAISAATSGTVTASYDPATDKIALASAGTIVLGSASDTSNFLQVARLNNNGTGAVASSSALGGIKVSSVLSSANFSTAVSDGGAGAGEFKVNGVSIAYNASTATVSDILGRINNSTAGVIAAYDMVNDKFTLTNKTTGDLGVALEDVTGNFLAASGLSSGTLARGKDLLYTVNGGGELSSQSNTITEVSSGIAGLSVTGLAIGTTAIEIGNDTSKIKTAITDFVAEYNKTQSLLDGYTASSTDSKGVVTAGVLAGEAEANSLSTRLRALANGEVTGLSGTLKYLSTLGFSSNGNDDKVTLTSLATLDTALTTNLSSVREMFTQASTGFAAKLSSYLDTVAKDDGTLDTRLKTLTKQSTNIDSQIESMERMVLATRQQLITSFVSMETAQAGINQQLAYLTRAFPG